MILVLKGADFSANNVGRVTIFHELTKRIFEKCTRFELGSDQSIVVDTFIKSVDEIGVLSHLSCTFFPWLASSNSEALYNFSEEAAIIYDDSKFLTSDGRVNPTVNGLYATLTTPIPTINFFCLLRQDYPSVSYIGNPYFAGNGIMVTACSATGSMISDEIYLYNAGNGYKNTDSDLTALLIEVGSLSNLEIDSKTLINGKVVAVTDGYDKANEPLSDQLLYFSPNYATYVSGQARTIAIAGDGTELTSIQRSGLISAIKEMQLGLAALEID